jgi:hypothetical protein
VAVRVITVGVAVMTVSDGVALRDTTVRDCEIVLVGVCT